MPIDFDAFKRELLRNPLDFLRHYMLTIAGGLPDGKPDRKTFHVEDKNMQVDGFCVGHFRSSKKRPSVKISTSDNQSIGNFKAYYLSMWRDNANSLADKPIADVALDLPLAGSAGSDDNPDIMITSGLSACTVGISKAVSGRQKLVHIQPQKLVVGPNVYTQPEFNRLPEERKQEIYVYGMAHGSATASSLLGGNENLFAKFVQRDGVYGGIEGGGSASFIGIRTVNSWRFYAQIIGGPQGPIKGAIEITEGMGLD